MKKNLRKHAPTHVDDVVEHLDSLGLETKSFRETI
jgi:hypothetical protein